MCEIQKCSFYSESYNQLISKWWNKYAVIISVINNVSQHKLVNYIMLLPPTMKLVILLMSGKNYHLRICKIVWRYFIVCFVCVYVLESFELVLRIIYSSFYLLHSSWRGKICFCLKIFSKNIRHSFFNLIFRSTAHFTTGQHEFLKI